MEGDLNGQGDLNVAVALGLDDPPPHFKYSEFESDVGRECIFEPESESDPGHASDCVIVAMGEKSSLNKGSSSKMFGVDREENVKFNGQDVPMKDPKMEECDGDDNHVPLKEPKKEECDVHYKVEPSKDAKMGDDDDDDDDKGEDDDDDKGQDDDKDFDGNKKIPKSESDVQFKSNNRRTAAEICEELEENLKVGTEFPDLEKVYLLYCEYGRYKGFSVRKGEQRYFGKTSNIRFKEFNCSCEGLPNNRSRKHQMNVYKKLLIRSNCKARVSVSRDDLGSFIVGFFETEHNHLLVECDQTFLLRSTRHMSYAKKSVLEALNSAGIGVTSAFNFMAKECGGVENVGFTKKDAYHHMDRVRMETKVEDGDARLLMEYFSMKSTVDPFFFCKYQLDDDGRLMNIFFRDNRCAVDYNSFGDVLSVDTTYRTNRYNLICCPFVGINHHTRNVMFGMAMLSNETTATFKWLFETFLQSMNGKQPTVIFSDQCKAMMNAIDVVFSNSKHRLCQWHIMQNCTSHFGKMQDDTAFQSLWYKCMNYHDNEKDFETSWNKMLESVEDSNRSWFDGMYNMRHRWASCFSKGIFTAGLLATSRSELTNKVLKDVVHRTIALSTFVKQYEGILNNWRSTERMEDTWGIWNPGQAISNSGLLQKAARVFTRTIYKQFEHDYANCVTTIIDVKSAVYLANNVIEYTARNRIHSSTLRKVVFNAVTNYASCDCGKWETEGLICRHILKVLIINNVHEFPDSMIYRRWTKRAKDLQPLPQQNGVEESSTMMHMTFANEFMRHMSDLVSTAMEYEPLRVKLVQRMKEVNSEFSEFLRDFVASQPHVKEPPNLIVPLYRDPRKICPRGFANVNKDEPKSVKRKRNASTKYGRGSKAKENRTSPPRTQEEIRSKEQKNGGNPPKNNKVAANSSKGLDDIDDFLNLTL